MPTRWTPEQVKLVRKLARTVTPRELAERVSQVGPRRSVDAVTCWANSRRISIRYGRTTARIRRRPRHVWDDAQVALLRRLAGTLGPDEIAERINAAFGLELSGHAVQHRAMVLRVSLRRTDGLTMNEMVAIFPAHRRAILAEVRAGHLVPARRSSGVKGSTWIFRREAVEAWIRARPHLFDWRRVRAGYWQDLVRLVSLRSPYLGTAQVAQHVGVHPATVQRWIINGKVDGVVKIRNGRLTGYRIPASSLVQVEMLAVRRVSTAG